MKRRSKRKSASITSDDGVEPAKSETDMEALAIDEQETAPSSTSDDIVVPVTSAADMKEALPADEQHRGLDESIGLIKQGILDVTSKLEDLKECMKSQTRMQKLNWAIGNAHVGSFDCFPTIKNDRSSASVLSIILCHFKNGEGKDISNYRANLPYGNAEERFRTAISDQIYLLTGQRPRIVLESKQNNTSSWMIYES